eukprot:1845610-Amphidinium_carterae.1
MDYVVTKFRMVAEPGFEPGPPSQPSGRQGLPILSSLPLWGWCSLTYPSFLPPSLCPCPFLALVHAPVVLGFIHSPPPAGARAGLLFRTSRELNPGLPDGRRRHDY